MNKRRFFVALIFAGLGLGLVMASSCPPKTILPPALNGWALAIGLNGVDPAHYAGWSGNLTGCEPDALDMKAIAESQGLKAKTLLTAEATRSAVLAELAELASKLKADDLLVVSYSGHGGQVPDDNGDEVDGLDETWCLYDGQLLDDELFGAWTKFEPGVRILVFSDSCHSGTVLKMIQSDYEQPKPSRTKDLELKWDMNRALPRLDRRAAASLLDAQPELKERKLVRAAGMRAALIHQPATKPRGETYELRSVPPNILLATYNANKPFYKGIGMAAPREDKTSVKASLILISGCQDDQTSADMGYNGLFTLKLEQVWSNGAFSGDHSDFHKKIREAVLAANAGQSPNFALAGVELGGFVNQRPYLVQR
jgi:hypothetical protein